MQGKRDQMVRGKLKREIFPKDRYGCFASLCGEGVVVGPKVVLQRMQEVCQRLNRKRICESEFTKLRPIFNQRA